MEQEAKQTFTRRIVGSNRSQLIVVLFDIFDCYLEEAVQEYKKGAGAGAVSDSLRHACLVLEHLKDDLDYAREPGLCERLFSIYDYCQRQIARSLYQNRIEGAMEAKRLMWDLREAFLVVAQEDQSEPLVENKDQRVAGYTYGRSDVTEASTNYDPNRGFLA